MQPHPSPGTLVYVGHILSDILTMILFQKIFTSQLSDAGVGTITFYMSFSATFFDHSYDLIYLRRNDVAYHDAGNAIEIHVTVLVGWTRSGLFRVLSPWSQKFCAHRQGVSMVKKITRINVANRLCIHLHRGVKVHLRKNSS